MITDNAEKYYLPSPSSWPIKGSMALICVVVGLANWLHNAWFGIYLFFIGLLFLIYVVHGWFGVVIHENRQGLLKSKQIDRSFRLGMYWFIFSEVVFFATFFGSLFYVRTVVMPLLGGETSVSHIVLWPNFNDVWPLLKNPDPNVFIGPGSVMYTWGVPAINTAILLSSGVTITIAHWSLLKSHRQLMLYAQLATVLLGFSFLIMQAREYLEAYLEKGLTLASGIYGTTFFMLTGFHGLHVTIGTIGLCVILYRMLKNDFNTHNHFGFEAVSWYWHFVDVVWLFLFIFVYWI